MAKVELIYEHACPNIQAARVSLLQAFSELKLTPHWAEWEVSDPDIPDYAQNLGSPTILVNGYDVSGTPDAGHDLSCRVYRDNNGNLTGTPAITDIKDAIIQGHDRLHKRSKPWYLTTGVLPVMGTAFLPKLACPACWPAYAGLLSALGLGFIDYTPYLLPLTLGFLFIALVTLAFRADRRRGYSPFILGFVASLVLMIGKFGYESDIAMYVGLGLLISASVWNTWPSKKAADEPPCPSCITSQSTA